MINSETNQMSYTTVAGVVTYTIGFAYFLNMSNEPELQVTLDGVTLVYGIDYTLSGDKLSIELVVDPGDAKTLIISRDVPLTQTSDYVVGRIDPDQIERDFDRSVMRDQDIRLDIGIIESKIPAEASPDNQLADKAYVDAHTERTDNPHSVTKAQVGLGNCDNTSDLDKPISTATQAALDLKANSADLAPVATAGTLVSLNDTSIVQPAVGHFLMFDGASWINTVSSGTVGWGAILGNIVDQTDLMNTFAEYVRIDGSSTMTGVLKMRASESFKGAIAPSWDGVGFFKLNDNDSVTLMASMEETDGLTPATNNKYNIGKSAYKWKDLYLSGKAYVSTINNGFDIAVPVTNSADTFALLSDIAFKSADVELTTPASGQFLMYDGSKWINSTQGYANTDLSNLTPTGEAKFTAKANTGLDNLTDAGKNIGNWSSNVSNCITEIPQDIQLELDISTGTLTVKAGSKTYVPNGADTFDELVLANDLTYGPDGSATEYDLLYIRSDSSRLDFHTNNTSGTTAPSGSGFFWNTNTNTIKYYNSGTETNIQESIPIARVHRTNGSWDRIDQVFNGFGYMGLTVFALPGVKGLIPNGRNADGTPKSTEFSLTSVITKDITLAGTYRGVGIWLTATSISPVILGNVEGTGVWAYHEDINFNKSETGIEQACLVGIFDISSSVISNFKPKTAFHALDWSDSNIVSGWAMPSTKQLSLTLGASGTSYAAPADGWFVVSKVSGTSGAYFNLVNETAGIGLTSDGYQSGNKLLFVPVSKGDVVKCTYSFSGTTGFFRFVYANGAK